VDKEVDELGDGGFEVFESHSMGAKK
jgi:hypothetical protein